MRVCVRGGLRVCVRGGVGWGAGGFRGPVSPTVNVRTIGLSLRRCPESGARRRYSLSGARRRTPRPRVAGVWREGRKGGRTEIRVRTEICEGCRRRGGRGSDGSDDSDEPEKRLGRHEGAGRRRRPASRIRVAAAPAGLGAGQPGYSDETGLGQLAAGEQTEIREGVAGGGGVGGGERRLAVPAPRRRRDKQATGVPAIVSGPGPRSRNRARVRIEVATIAGLGTVGAAHASPLAAAGCEQSATRRLKTMPATGAAAPRRRRFNVRWRSLPQALFPKMGS